MMLLGLIILVLSQGQVQGVISILGRPPSLTLDALDCKTNKVSYARADEFCSKSKDHTVHRPSHRIVLAEHVDTLTVKAIRCTKTVSSSSHMCGSYSHMKLLAPPKYMERREISPQECKSMHESGIYRDGDTYPVTVNSVLHYQKVAKGQLTLTSDNVFCNGEQTWIGSVLHDQVMMFTDTVISIQEVQLELDFKSRSASDLTNRRDLDESCFQARSCLSSNESYVKLEEVGTCRIREIKSLMIEEYTVDTDKGRSDLIVSFENKIAIEKRSPLTPGLECQKQVNKYYATNIDDLYIIYDRDMGKETLKGVEVEGVNIRSQMVAESTFLSVITAVKSEDLHIETNARICSTIANAIESIELSPFTPNAVLKRQGDLIMQIQCEVKEVSVTLGESVDTHCLEGYLPVTFEGKEALISAGAIPETLVDAVIDDAKYQAGKRLVSLTPETDALWSDVWTTFTAG